MADDQGTFTEGKAKSMMAMPQSLPLEEVLNAFQTFNAGFRSLVLSTINENGDADASYAPTLQINSKFYVYVSELAAHTRNLLNSEKASILLIEPETEANLFRRQRSMIRVGVRWIGRDETDWSCILDQYEERLGKMMRNLRELKDFHLFELTPIEAIYVRGFGQAYKFVGEQLTQVDHIRDRGHGRSTLIADNK